MVGGDDAAVRVARQAARAQRFDDALQILLIAGDAFEDPIEAAGRYEGANHAGCRCGARLKFLRRRIRLHLHFDERLQREAEGGRVDVGVVAANDTPFAQFSNSLGDGVGAQPNGFSQVAKRNSRVFGKCAEDIAVNLVDHRVLVRFQGDFSSEIGVNFGHGRYIIEP